MIAQILNNPETCNQYRLSWCRHSNLFKHFRLEIVYFFLEDEVSGLQLAELQELLVESGEFVGSGVIEVDVEDGGELVVEYSHDLLQVWLLDCSCL